MKGLVHGRGELRERFYRSVAETLALLHTAPGYDRRQAMREVARILAATMKLPLVWIGRREPTSSEVEVIAAAGPSAAYAASLRLSIDEREPGGRGPAAIALRQRRARVTPIDAPEFAPWQEAARRYGFGSSIVAASTTRDSGQLTLVAYASSTGPTLGDELLDWAQRLADELAYFWDHQALIEREQRLRRYRDAQRTIQRVLLEQPDPQAVYDTLAHALVDIAGAAAVDVYADDGGELLRRVALAGPMAEAMRLLPVPPRHADGPLIYTPTRAFMQGASVVRTHPAAQADMNQSWRIEPLAAMGALGCWPLFAAPADDATAAVQPVGVFAIVTHEADVFDEEMCGLLDEIADAAGLALVQHAQRHALLQEQQRQTYLALHDALTGLPNRRALDVHLEGVLARAGRHQHPAAVGLLDLDDLKAINDRHGHAEGDRVLREVATRLRAALRDEDYVARLGGDEFVLVFEQIEHEHYLEGLLDRVWQDLQQPIRIGHTSVKLSASLGITLFSRHAPASGEQMLRRADQAMYQAKARKHQRTCWWSASPAQDEIEPVAEPERSVPAYGVEAAAMLRLCAETLQLRLPALMHTYRAELMKHAAIAGLLLALPARHGAAVEQRLSRHLRTLLRPELDAAGHRADAMQSGFFFAASGVEEVWMMEAIERLRDLFVDAPGLGAGRDRRPLGIVLQRLGMEQQWQLESMRELQRRRVALLARINALAWSATGYNELIQGVVDALIAHDEVLACTVGRPDASGHFTYEAVAGEAFANYLRALGRGEAAPIDVHAGSSEGAGPSGRAWRSATIEHCVHYDSDPAMASWQEVAALLGIVSSVAVPLSPQRSTPIAVLTIYSTYVGGFQSEDQRAFVEQIKAVLDLALARLSPLRSGSGLLPFFVRERWRAMITTDALQMHYQPVVRLVDGKVVELEALARLRYDDGSLLLPDRFLPAFNDDDLLGLFREGLAQVASCRLALERTGWSLDMSVNVPAAALEDPRYVETTAAVLTAAGFPPSALLLEILESPAGTELAAPLAMAGTEAFRALGVRLVEDDLGAGYSSLIRLRQWPFARIKIDQAIVLRAIDDPLRTLRFIRQLIRLGHELGLEVVVEGLETEGLIEAALILGADLGQGYALARPMPPQLLADWLGQFRAGWSAIDPGTMLGALAGAIRWEEQLVALPNDPALWQRHAESACACGGYLRRAGVQTGSLLESHFAMHAAAVAGPHDEAYRHWRQRFLSALIASGSAAGGVQPRAV